MRPQLWSAVIFIVGAAFGALADRVVVLSKSAAAPLVPAAPPAAVRSVPAPLPEGRHRAIVAERDARGIKAAVGGVPGQGSPFVFLRVGEGTDFRRADGSSLAFEELRVNDLIEFEASGWSGAEPETDADVIVLVFSPAD